LRGTDAVLSGQSSIGARAFDESPSDFVNLIPGEDGSAVVFAATQVSSVSPPLDSVPDVLSVVAEIEVGQIYARSVITPMENVLFVSDRWSNHDAVDPAMGSYDSAPVTAMRVRCPSMKLPVPLGVGMTCPSPAGVFASRLVDLDPEAGEKIFNGCLHGCNLTWGRTTCLMS
jgi:hypothetical protein